MQRMTSRERFANALARRPVDHRLTERAEKRLAASDIDRNFS